MDTVYTIPQTIKDYIAKQGYPIPYDAMKTYIEDWYTWQKAEGKFYDFNEKDGQGNYRKIHRRSIHPANRVCREWASLLLNDETTIQCNDETCNKWLADYFDKINFKAHGQGLIQRAFGLGTGAWALWLDLDNNKMQVRRYDARMMIPLSWDDDGVTECAFCTQVVYKGKTLDQVQMHVIENGTYHIKTACFKDSEPYFIEEVNPDFDTLCPTPTFAVVRPAIENQFVDLSPYGQSVFAEAIDAVQAVDLSYDAVFNEVQLSKMRVFMGDMLFEVQRDEDGKAKRVIPFGIDDDVVIRKVQSSNDELIKEYAPTMRTESQTKALRTALQTLGDLTGFGLTYFDIDDAGGVKTATEVSSDNSALMRNIRKHENLLEGAIAQISRAVLFCARTHLGEQLPEEGNITVQFDDSIITDTAAEKAQDMSELNITLNPWEFRTKWYGEDEATAKANVPGGYTAVEPSFVEE